VKFLIAIIVRLPTNANTPAQILLKFDVGAKELPQVEFGWILALLHWGFVEAVFQLSNFRGVIRPPCPHLVNKNTLARNGSLKQHQQHTEIEDVKKLLSRFRFLLLC
jgi:hypothetical protein